MNIELKFFDLNGNEVDPDTWADTVEDQMVKIAFDRGIQNVTASTSDMICPIHGGKATLNFSIRGKEVEIKADACCNEFAASVVSMAQHSFF